MDGIPSSQSAGAQVEHGVLVGRGTGVVGYGAIVPGPAGQVLTSTGPAADPVWTTFTGSGSGVPEAPNDGKYYGRHNAGWADLDSIYFSIFGGTVFGSIAIHANFPSFILIPTGPNNIAGLFGTDQSQRARWAIYLNNADTESGSNSGSNFSIDRYDDAGNLIDAVLSISRQNGSATFKYPLKVSSTSTGNIIAMYGSVSGQQGVFMGADPLSTDLAVNVHITPKGGGGVNLYSNGALQFSVTGPAPISRYIAVAGSMSGNPTIQTVGGGSIQIPSLVMTGSPTAPTPPTADNSTLVATTAFVKTNLAALTFGFGNVVSIGTPVLDQLAQWNTSTSIKGISIGPTLTTQGGILNTTAGGGNVMNSGLPIAGQLAVWVNSVQIQGVSIAGAGLQPLDGDLTALSNLTGTNTIYYRSGVDTWSPVLIGANLTFLGGTLSATGGGGGGGDVFLANNNVFTGSNTFRSPGNGTLYEALSGGNASITMQNFQAAPGAANLTFQHSRGASFGAQAAVIIDDPLGQINFKGSDGVGFVGGATLYARVESTPTAGFVPTYLTFFTTDTVFSEKMRLSANGTLTLPTAGVSLGPAACTVPTPATADSSTKIATTAFVKAQGYSVNAGDVFLTGTNVFTGSNTFRGGITVEGLGGGATAGQTWTNYQNSTNSAVLRMQHSRGATFGAQAAVQVGDILGQINFQGSDGSAFANGAVLQGFCEAVPTAGHVQSSLRFMVDNGSALTEYMRIAPTGRVTFQGTVDGPTFIGITATRNTPTGDGINLAGAANQGQIVAQGASSDVGIVMTSKGNSGITLYNASFARPVMSIISAPGSDTSLSVVGQAGSVQFSSNPAANPILGIFPFYIQGRTNAGQTISGYVGEYIEAQNGPTAGLAAGIWLGLGAISLPAGDWEIWGQCSITAATYGSQFYFSLSTTGGGFDPSCAFEGLIAQAGDAYCGLPRIRKNVSVPTTYFVAVWVNAGTSYSASANLRARRMS